MTFNDTQLIEIINDWPLCTIEKEPFTLASGNQSHAFFDWGGPLGNINTTLVIARAVLDFTIEFNIYSDQFVGVPEGMSTFANYCNMLNGATSHAQARKVAKKRGSFIDQNYVFAPQGNILILEDTLTTGNSTDTLLRTLNKTPDVIVMGILTLTNRMMVRSDGKTAEEYFHEQHGLPLYSLTEAPDFIPEAYARAQPRLGSAAPQVKQNLEQEFRIRL